MACGSKEDSPRLEEAIERHAIEDLFLLLFAAKGSRSAFANPRPRRYNEFSSLEFCYNTNLLLFRVQFTLLDKIIHLSTSCSASLSWNESCPEKE